MLYSKLSVYITRYLGLYHYAVLHVIWTNLVNKQLPSGYYLNRYARYDAKTYIKLIGIQLIVLPFEFVSSFHNIGANNLFMYNFNQNIWHYNKLNAPLSLKMFHGQINWVKTVVGVIINLGFGLVRMAISTNPKPIS